MIRWFASLNGAVTLSIIALLTLIARVTFLDAMYVPEFRDMLPESQPATIALVSVTYMLVIGIWLWSLVSASHGNKFGLVTSLGFSLFTALGGGFLTLVVLCPNGCAAEPVGSLIVCGNLISGILASVALSLRIMRMDAPVGEKTS